MAYDERYPLKDYLNSINLNKNYLMDEDPLWEKNYPVYVINRCMSQHLDTVMYANEMNQCSHLDKKLQYDFFINIVRIKKRYSPWIRKDKIKDLDVVKSYYKYSDEKAEQALKILRQDQINFIKKKLETGGRK
jgi:hypothetical protein